MKRKQISWAFALVILVLTIGLNPEQVVANNNTPIAIINLSGNSTTVNPGIPISFDGTQSYDPDNTNIIAYNWWYVDGVVQSQGSTADKKIFSYTFTLPAGVNSKTYQIKLTVRDNEYITASKTITVTVTLSGRTEYYLTDHLGSIRTTIDQNGTVIGFDDYDPFGNVLPGRSLNLGTPNDLNKFTGHERDQEGGLDLDYMLVRNYDSELGRFYSVDPLQYKRSWLSPYNYVQNNPLIRYDPTGMLDDYILNNKTGEVELLERTDSNSDVLYAQAETGEVDKTKSVSVKKRADKTSLISDLSNKVVGFDVDGNGKLKDTGSFTTSKNINEVRSLFEFVGINSDVEWLYQEYNDGVVALLTIHENSIAPKHLPNIMNRSYSNLKIDIHSHAKTYGNRNLYEPSYNDERRANFIQRISPNSIVRVWSPNETFFFRWFDATSNIPLNYQNEGHGWDW